MSVWLMKGCSFPLPVNLSIYNIHMSQYLKQKMEPLQRAWMCFNLIISMYQKEYCYILHSEELTSW